jgi:hypothetical protein
MQLVIVVCASVKTKNSRGWLCKSSIREMVGEDGLKFTSRYLSIIVLAYRHKDTVYVEPHVKNPFLLESPIEDGSLTIPNWTRVIKLPNGAGR